MLLNKNLPTIEQINIYKKYHQEDVLDYFKKNHNTIIVKSNIGTCGKSVYLINDQEELFKKIDYLLTINDSISISPYYNIKNEYRVIVLNNEVRLIFGKIKPIVIGDGKKTVKELAQEYNDYYINYPDKIINSNYIPKENEQIELNFKFNLSSGAKTFTNIEDNLKNKICELALKVMNELNIAFASVDVIHTTDGELLVMEANSGVTLNNFVLQNKNDEIIVYNIYRDAIKLMFVSK